MAIVTATLPLHTHAMVIGDRRHYTHIWFRQEVCRCVLQVQVRGATHAQAG